MGQFLEERLPIGVRYGAQYGDQYNVDITVTASGNEYRRLVHPYPVRVFHIDYTKESTDIYSQILNLYHRAYGRYAGFRAWCRDDYSTNGQTDDPTALDQTLEALTSTTYQLAKTYGTDKTGIDIGQPKRTIYKPISGTTKVAIGGAEQFSGWTVDTTTGVITFTSPPGGVVTAGCEFDIPVRFDTDLVVTHSHPTIRDIESITLVELLNP